MQRSRFAEVLAVLACLLPMSTTSAGFDHDEVGNVATNPDKGTPAQSLVVSNLRCSDDAHTDILTVAGLALATATKTHTTCTAATHDRDSSKDNRDMNEEMCTSHTPDDKITQLPFSKLSRFRTLRLEREVRQSSFIRPGLRVEAFSFLGLPETAALRYKPKTTRTLLSQLLNQANPEAQPLAHCTVGIDGRCFGITPGAN